MKYNFEELINKAFDYALDNETFSKTAIVRNASDVCVFGLGKYFRDAFIKQRVKERFHVTYLCDNNVERMQELSLQKEYSGLRFIKPEQLVQLKKPVVIMMLGDPRTAIAQLSPLIGRVNCITYNDLILDDIMHAEKTKEFYRASREKALRVLHMLDDKSQDIYANILCLRIAPHLAKRDYEEICVQPQYFPVDVYTLTAKENVIDCGAYVGDTLNVFLEITKNTFNKYHAFELDHENHQKLAQNVAVLSDDRIKTYPYGVWSESKDISYGRMSSDDSYSVYNESEVERAKVVCLDKFIGGEEITLVKMDIEGAEMQALLGCKDIIKKYKPKMAICVYHRIEDLWEIPIYLKEVNPLYDLHIRHHADYWVAETVCYAV